jgi:hypothetical protein
MISDRGIWLSTEETDTHEYDAFLAAAIIKYFSSIKSVVDIGCGNGRYTVNFLNHEISCKGFDGSPLTPELTGGLCEVMDFSKPVDIGQFEMVLSLEVGEHIPAEYEQIFIWNLCYASNKFILLSWAVEGQYGIGHINCRNNNYIIGELDKLNFRYVKWMSEILRDESTLPWFKNTLMLFIKWNK